MTTTDPGEIAATSLTGSEIVSVNTGPVWVGVTTQQIANLSGISAANAIVNLNTVGAATLSAANLYKKIIIRGGSQSGSPFTDTTDTAAAIVATIQNPVIGESYTLRYWNKTNAIATIAAGSGVTLSPTTLTLQPNAWVEVLVYLTSLTAVTFTVYEYGQMVSDSADNTKQLAFSTSGNGTGIVTTLASASAAATTSTLPPVTGVLATTSGSDLFVTDIYRSTAATSNSTATPTAISGMSAIPITNGTGTAVYRFRLVLPNTANGTSGAQVTFALTTAVLGAINCTSVSTATGVASVVQYNATTTSGTALFANTAASLLIVVEGTFTCTTAGTIAFNYGLNTGTTTAQTQIGSFAELTRIS